MNTRPVVRFVFGGVELASAGLGREYTLVYDGACRVCSRLVALLERWDRHRSIEVIPSQNTSVPVRFPWIPAAAYAESIQLIGPGGRTGREPPRSSSCSPSCRAADGSAGCSDSPSWASSPIASIAGSPATAIASAVANTASSGHST